MIGFERTEGEGFAILDRIAILLTKNYVVDLRRESLWALVRGELSLLLTVGRKERVRTKEIVEPLRVVVGLVRKYPRTKSRLLEASIPIAKDRENDSPTC